MIVCNSQTDRTPTNRIDNKLHHDLCLLFQSLIMCANREVKNYLFQKSETREIFICEIASIWRGFQPL